MLNLTRFGRTPARLLWAVAMSAILMMPLTARAAGGTGNSIAGYSGLTADQSATLYQIARDTWKFYSVDIDPHTNLPMDNVTFAGGSAAPTSYGTYTSAANIGVYLWAVVAANDLGLVSRPQARNLIAATLNEVSHLDRYQGFLHQWYDTKTGHVILNPGQPDCAAVSGTADNCSFISQVDNGWYVSGLIVVRDAMPELRSLVNSLMAPINFGIFYDNGPENQCNVNPANGDPTGQMYGGYYAGVGPANYHNGALYSDPRISAYIGMGLRQMPGNVWWRTWRVLPPKACPTDPDFSWTGQGPGTGYWQDYTDPQSGQLFHVWEGHYTYPTDPNLVYVPTWGGGMFEALMANEVVPETSWGPRSFGLNDVRNAQVQMKYATEQLHYKVWGLSPSSTADDSGGYNTYGAEGLVWPYEAKKGLSQCYGCATEDVVTPHASFLALDVLPKEAFANIQALRTLYPGVYGVDGFFDAVNPTTGAVGHRYLVLDQSMIMAALDNALKDRALQRHFARDSVSWAAQLYLGYETMSIH